MGGVFGVLDCWWRVGEDEELRAVDRRFGVCSGDEVPNDSLINVPTLHCKSLQELELLTNRLVVELETLGDRRDRRHG